MGLSASCVNSCPFSSSLGLLCVFCVCISLFLPLVLLSLSLIYFCLHHLQFSALSLCLNFFQFIWFSLPLTESLQEEAKTNFECFFFFFKNYEAKAQNTKNEFYSLESGLNKLN